MKGDGVVTESRAMPQRPPLATVALLAGASLGYEVLLIRLLAIVQWHHYAHLVISLALLGIGVGGSVLTIAGDWLLQRYRCVVLSGCVLYGLSLLFAFALAQQVPFHAETLLWDPLVLLRLAGVYLMLAIPFAFVGALVGLVLMRHARESPRVYSADLLGAGAGSLLIVVGLYLVEPAEALRVLAGTAMLAVAAAWWELGASPARLGWVLPLLAIWPLCVPGEWTRLRVTAFKPLAQALVIKDARLIASRSSPRGRIDVVESPALPFRHAPGLSLTSLAPIPAQLGLFTDAAGFSAIVRNEPAGKPPAYLADLTSALPYALDRPERVLVLEAGGGAPIWQALLHGARRVDATISDHRLVGLIGDTYASYAGGLLQRPEVTVHTVEPRRFVRSHGRYSLIVLDFAQVGGAAPSGLQAAGQSPTLTVEAVVAYLDRLDAGATLAITHPISLPPREGLKLFATLAAALRARGLAPARHLAMVRDWQAATLLARLAPWSAADSEALQRFCRERSFDAVFYPGMPLELANRYNVLDRPWYAIGARALVGEEAADFVRDYKFNIVPATDLRPYFGDFFKWRTLPEIVSARGRGGAALFDAGYPVIVAALVQALLLGLVLIVAPVGLRSTARLPGRALLYFTCLGLAFLFIEIVFLNALVLFLDDAVLAAAVTLAAFLVFAGLGSRHAQRLQRPQIAAPRSALIVAAMALVYLAALQPLLTAAAALPDPARAWVAVALIAPLAYAMGLPLPLGLCVVAAFERRWLPWAWCVNGCASVASPLLAALLAMHVGWPWLMAAALLLYALAALALRPSRLRQSH